MITMTTTKRLVLALAAVAGLVLVTAAGVWAIRDSGSEPATPDPRTATVETTPGAEERPWERERMDSAIPLPMPTQR